MQVYLAGIAPWRDGGGYDKLIETYHPYTLESFYYCDEDTERLMPFYGDFLLDSGAFTFMQDKGNVKDWEEYIERYADFIKRNNVQKFFELDIDKVVGYEKVKQYRKRLEDLTGRQCIPVWHKSRGYAEYVRHCEEYSYVAIGGYVVKELTSKDYELFPMMIQKAHQNGAKVHCLGFTKLSCLSKYHFDSVDSTAWTTGNRFGFIYKFDGKTMRKTDAPEGCRIGKPRDVAFINYVEWIKFQNWAKTHL